MTRKTRIIATALTGVALAIGGAAVAYAQAGGVSAAMAAGSVGEQADGYLGVRGSVAAGVRDEVDAINIKRRAKYTSLAQERGVTIKEVAAATGCETLSRVGAGRAYLLPDGTWRVKESSAIALPGYCAS